MKNNTIKHPPYLDVLSNIFDQSGYALYIVGGFVRDALLGYEADDIDICAGANPYEVIKMLEDESAFTVSQSSLPMGTLIIRHKGVSLEYTSFRKESYRRDGSHTPQNVSLGATLNEDALRRDFTCNALYYDIQNRKIIDFFFGINDIKNRVLKTTREPQDVFCEDALRILRMARISSETMFLPVKDTMAAANSLRFTLLKLSEERIRQEINKLLLSDVRYTSSNHENIVQGIKVLFESGTAQVLFPGTSFEKSALSSKAKSLPVKIALFLLKCSSLISSTNYICPNSDVKKDVSFLLDNMNFSGNFLDILIKHGYRRGKLLEELFIINKVEHSGLSKYLNNMVQKDYTISMKTLAISGNEIKKTLGIKDSPAIGIIKKNLLSYVIENPEHNTKFKLLEHIKKEYKSL